MIITIFSQLIGALRGGHWGILETAKPKKKSSKTAKKFGQNRKPHLLSK